MPTPNATDAYAFRADPVLRASVLSLSNSLDNAYDCYAREAGDGWNPDYQGAYEYREEGYAIGEAVFAHPIHADEDDVEAFHEALIEGLCASFPESAGTLISTAAQYRMAEMAREQVQAVAA